jgi:ABC-type nickel/cobalt efflux system permease component RcnA
MYTSAAALGVLHGSDPSHGWPLALTFAAKRGSALSGLLASLVLALGHLASSIAVVAAIWLLGRIVISYLHVVQLIAGALLLLIGVRSLLRLVRRARHEVHVHPTSLKALAHYAILLGFAHEEELALAAIVLLGVNPLALAIVYSASVLVAMMVWTILGMLVAKLTARRLEGVEKVIDLASSALLLLIGCYVVFEALS